MKNATCFRRWLLASFAGIMLGTAALAIKPYFNTFSDLVAKSGEGVVLVVSPMPSGAGQEIGTGFIIDNTGLIVTNAHVVEGGDADKIVIRAKGSSKLYDVTVVGGDGLSDVALLRIDAWEDFKKNVAWRALPLVAASTVRPGDEVWALGMPVAYLWTVTRGYLSASERKTELLSPMYYLQADLRITNGNSGGPLFDRYGNVIGINNMIQVVTGGEISFAIPTEIIEKVVRALRIKEDTVIWPRLGITYIASADGAGVAIASLVKDSPLSGVAKVGERIVSVTTKNVTDVKIINNDDLPNAIFVLDVGDTAWLTILDEHDVSRVVKITVGDGRTSSQIASVINAMHSLKPEEKN